MMNEPDQVEGILRCPSCQEGHLIYTESIKEDGVQFTDKHICDSCGHLQETHFYYNPLTRAYQEHKPA